MYPPVKLGGLAASQYSTVGPLQRKPRRAAPLPGPPGHIHVIQSGRLRASTASASSPPTTYTSGTFSNASRSTSAQILGTASSVGCRPRARSWTTSGEWSPRAPRLKASRRSSFPAKPHAHSAEFLSTTSQLTQLGFTPLDIADLREQAAGIPRHQSRSAAHQNCRTCRRTTTSSGAPAPGIPPRFIYSDQFNAVLLEMPRVLAAFDTRWGDARTNVSTYLQLQLQMDRRDNKADGVLNGPTTESWFDHWYRHLDRARSPLRPR